jgi:hypothetical protein
MILLRFAERSARLVALCLPTLALISLPTFAAEGNEAAGSTEAPGVEMESEFYAG